MLKNLHIENVAVIEKADIDFEQGLNVLTGETGAGKSILIDSINAVLGQRTSRELIRTGAQTAYVSALFDEPGVEALAMLEALGYTSDDGTILIQRRMSPDGKNNCRINGCAATTLSLKELGKLLISIHGQHDNQTLLDPSVHYKYLDLLGGLDNLVNDFRKSYRELKSLFSKIESIVRKRDEGARRADYLRYVISELEKANIRAGESAELNERRNLLSNSEKIVSAVKECGGLLEGADDFSTGAIGAVELACETLRQISGYSEGLSELTKRLSGLAAELKDVACELSPLANELDFDPNELAGIEGRLDILYRLGKKYGGGEEEILAVLSDSKKELSESTVSDDDIQQLKQMFNEHKAATHRLAETLSDERHKCAERFSAAVAAELESLDMHGVKFIVDFQRRSMDDNGIDNIEFLISANAGEDPKPLAKIASGGELSRIMLAIRNTMSSCSDVGTMIFDEIDSGTSGRAAQKIGRKLKSVSDGRQVICVTHLAQIASYADRHMLIEKGTSDGVTRTTVDALDYDGRCRELARIIGGESITEATLAASRELLKGVK